MSYDNRSSVRVPVELTARVWWDDGTGYYEEADTKTANMSGNGLFLTLPARLAPQTSITFTLLLPREITRTPVELIGRGRVVRNGYAGAVAGIAAVIDDYQLLPSRLDA